MHSQVPAELVAAFVPRLLWELSQNGRVDQAVAAARRALGTRDDAWMPVLWMSVDDPDLRRLGYSLQPSDQEATLNRVLKGNSPPPVRPFSAPVRLPQRTNPVHVGRPDDLVALGRALTGAGSELVSPTVIVTGATGAGKTQLLLDFAYHYGPLFEG